MLEPGTVARSTAGRDKDRFYMITRTENGYAWIADGKARRLHAPKRKSVRHLAATNAVLDIVEVTSDNRLRAMLRPFNGTAGDTEREGS